MRTFAVSDKPQNRAKSSDRIDEKASEKHALNPAIAKESQADAKDKAATEEARTNRHDGSAGKSD